MAGGETFDAQKMWSAIVTDQLSMYRQAGAKVVQAARDASRTATGQLQPTVVNAILADEHDRWLKTSAVRLRHFGYRPDSY